MSSSRPVSGISLNPPASLGIQSQVPPSPGANVLDTPLPETAAQDTVVPSEALPADGPSPPFDAPHLDSQEPTAPITQDTVTAEVPPADAVSTLANEAEPIPDAQLFAAADAQNTLEASGEPTGPLLQNFAQYTPLTGANAQDTTAQDTATASEVPPASDTSTPPGVHTHLPIAASFLEPPRASLLASDTSTPRDSYVPPSLNNSTHLLAEKQTGSDVEEPSQTEKRKPLFKRPLFLVLALLALLIIAVAVVVPVYFVVIKKHTSNASAASSGGGSSTSSAPGSSPTAHATTGGDGSIITTETGETFTYRNPFGGFCE
jgi:hypothetical protein